MKEPSSKFRYLTYILLVISAFSAGAIYKTELTPTTTPGKLLYINGYLYPCQLITPPEIKVVLGIGIVVRGYFSPEYGYRVCNYTSLSDGRTPFSIYVTTDASLKIANSPYSAVDIYQRDKKNAKLIYEYGGPFKFGEIENLGDDAFLDGAVFLTFNILNNDIYYEFTSNGLGIDHDTLMKLVKIAIQRMP